MGTSKLTNEFGISNQGLVLATSVPPQMLPLWTRVIIFYCFFLIVGIACLFQSRWVINTGEKDRAFMTKSGL